MIPITQVKLEIFIPYDHVDALREALAEAGAGVIGNYDHCLSIQRTEGYWRPRAGADPYDGKVGELSHGVEAKVEVNCPAEKVKSVLKAIHAIHPYEEPVINVVPLVNGWFGEEEIKRVEGS